MDYKLEPQAPPLEKGSCKKKKWLSTDHYFREQWNKAEDLASKIKMGLQYPKDAPEDLNNPKSEDEIESFKKWSNNIYDMSCDLAEIFDHLSGLAKDNGQIEEHYVDTQRTDDPMELPHGFKNGE